MLAWWQAGFLGVVQGLTEFLPISSSGHLVLAERLLHTSTATPLTFDIFVHLGTLVATVVYFYRDLLALRIKDWVILAVATVPAAVVGIVARDMIEATKFSPLILGGSFFVTAGFLFLTIALLKQDEAASPWEQALSPLISRWRRWSGQQAEMPHPTVWQAFGVGVFQALALLPAISRSGSTLFGGVLVGLKREQAFRFAFVVGIPAVAGALAMDGLKVLQSSEWMVIDWPKYVFATVVAGLVGFASLGILNMVIKRSRLDIFAWYCVFVGILSVLFV